MQTTRVAYSVGAMAVVFAAGWISARISPAHAAVTVPPAHFKCYSIAEAAPMFHNKPVVVTADDQFHTSDKLQIGKAELLCTPVLRKTVLNGPQAPDKGDHLKCYGIQGRPPGRQVHLYDQFGHNVPKLDVGPARLLCAPAGKDF